MAYALDEDIKEQAQQQPGAAAVPTGIQAAQGQPQTGGGSATPGSKFIGFDQYLRANQGAAERTGERLAKTAETKGQAAQQGIQRAQADFWTKMQQGTGDVFKPGTTAATSAEAEKLAGTTYTGPKEFREVASPELYKQVQEAGDYARNLGTETGRQAILQQGQPGSYGGFQSTLDAALAGATPAAGRFARLDQIYGSGALGNYLKGVEETTARTAGQTATAVGAQAAKFGEQAKTLKAQEDAPALAAAAEAKKQQDIQGARSRVIKAVQGARRSLLTLGDIKGNMARSSEYDAALKSLGGLLGRELTPDEIRSINLGGEIPVK